MSLDRLDRLLRLTASQDPSLHDWLITAWRETQADVPLDRALSLHGAHHRERNEALRTAARLLAPGATHYQQAKALQRALPYARHAPSDDPLDRALRRAWLAGRGYVPRSTRQLQRILQKEDARSPAPELTV